MFADDCILFYKDTKSTARNIKQSLDHYSIVSGQLVNYQKSKIRFSKGVLNTDKKETSQILHIPSTNGIGTYCGCINIDQKEKPKKILMKLKEDLDKNWRAKYLTLFWQ